MQLRLILITISTRDLDRAVRFYEALRWRRLVRGAEGVAIVQVGGMALAFWPRDKLAEDASVPVEERAFAASHLPTIQRAARIPMPSLLRPSRRAAPW